MEWEDGQVSAHSQLPQWLSNHSASSEPPGLFWWKQEASNLAHQSAKGLQLLAQRCFDRGFMVVLLDWWRETSHSEDNKELKPRGSSQGVRSDLPAGGIVNAPKPALPEEHADVPCCLPLVRVEDSQEDRPALQLLAWAQACGCCCPCVSSSLGSIIAPPGLSTGAVGTFGLGLVVSM